MTSKRTVSDQTPLFALSKSSLNKPILLVLFTLMGIGLVLVYSSSFIFATESFGDGLLFFKKQFVFTVLSIATLFGVAFIPFEWIRKATPLIWGAILILIVLTLIPGIGVRMGGASRWLQMPAGFRLEPSELLKIFLPFMLATVIFKSDKLSWGRLAFFLAPIVLLLKQPDFGSFAVSIFVIVTLLFIFGLKWRYVITGGGAVLTAFYFLVMTVDYRRARFMAYLDPWSDPEKGGYQVIQSLLSFYSGGIFGTGLGQGQSKLFFLPEAHTDFAFSVLGEETGFIGVAFVLILYAALMIRSFQIGTRVRDKYAQCVALGLSVVFSAMVLINIGVVLGLLPTKGLTLPFLSYGGSSLIAASILFGLLLNIDRTFNRVVR